MGVRGELYTTQVVLDNRTYFFNVKENRTGDVFLQVVESKSKNGEDFDRHAIVIFAEEMQKFCKGFENSLSFIEKNQKEQKKKAAEKKASKAAKSGESSGRKKIMKKKSTDDDRKLEDDGIKRSGKVHVVSKRTNKE